MANEVVVKPQRKTGNAKIKIIAWWIYMLVIGLSITFAVIRSKHAEKVKFEISITSKMVNTLSTMINSSYAETFNDDEREYLKTMKKVREKRGSIYSACMHSHLDVRQDENQDMKTIKHNRNAPNKLSANSLYALTKDAEWNCTYGLWAIALVIVFSAILLGAIIQFICGNYCISPSTKTQSCINC